MGFDTLGPSAQSPEKSNSMRMTAEGERNIIWCPQARLRHGYDPVSPVLLQEHSFSKSLLHHTYRGDDSMYITMAEARSKCTWCDTKSHATIFTQVWSHVSIWRIWSCPWNPIVNICGIVGKSEQRCQRSISTRIIYTTLQCCLPVVPNLQLVENHVPGELAQRAMGV